MIPVERQQEPSNFDTDVRMPGLKFLQSNPTPNSREFSKNDYWKKISPELYQLYNGICAYTGMWFSDDKSSSDGTRSIDHFFPKVKYPQYAYEWSNYRLTTQKMNNIKADSTGLVDPFEVQHCWFLLDLNTGLITVNNNLPDDTKTIIMDTIKILKLNLDDDMVQKRIDIINQYEEKDGECTFDRLQRYFPYIAYEIKRQNIPPDAEKE